MIVAQYDANAAGGVQKSVSDGNVGYELRLYPFDGRHDFLQTFAVFEQHAEDVAAKARQRVCLTDNF